MIEVGPRRIAAGHPAIAGHFPDDPLVPGVLLLEEVYTVAVAAFGPGRLIGFRRVKFLAPLRPDQDFRVAITPLGKEGFKFVCARHDCILAQGQLQLAEEPATG